MFRAYKAEKCKLRREKAKNSSHQFLEKERVQNQNWRKGFKQNTSKYSEYK